MVVVSLVSLVSVIASLVVTACPDGAGRDRPGVVAVVVLVVVTSMGFVVRMGLFFMAVMLMTAMFAWPLVGPVVMACMVAVVGGFSSAITVSLLLVGFCCVVMLVFIASIVTFMGAVVLVITVNAILSAACLVIWLDVVLLMAAGRSSVSRTRLV